MSLSSKEIENQIKNYTLTFIGVRNPEIEWRIKLPMFVDTFYALVQETGSVPSQGEFVKKYFELNEVNLRGTIVTPEHKLGLEARLRRTYPSLVRDLHLKVLLQESGFEVSYDRDTDVTSGVDHIVKYTGRLFMVHSYVGTSRGRLGREIKNRRHIFTGKHIDIILDMADPKVKKVGDFFLYSDNEVSRLRQELDKLTL